MRVVFHPDRQALLEILEIDVVYVTESSQAVVKAAVPQVVTKARRYED
jgi:hypothetical protein